MASIRLENDYLSQKLKDELEKIEQEEQEGRSIRPISSGNGWMFKHFLLKKISFEKWAAGKLLAKEKCVTVLCNSHFQRYSGFKKVSGTQIIYVIRLPLFECFFMYLPFFQEMPSIGYPDAGHATWSEWPSMALTGGVWRTCGGPENYES